MDSDICFVGEAVVSSVEGLDNLDLVSVRDYQALVSKGRYETGAMVVFIPDGAILPDDVVEELGIRKYLAGSDKNRVKASKMRGVVSHGVVYPLSGKRLEGVTINADEIFRESDGQPSLDKILGVVKFEETLPAKMQGKRKFVGQDKTINYEIGNIRKYNDVLLEGEDVCITEKIHGTWFCVGFHSKVGYFTTSKGLSKQGVVFDPEEQANIYTTMFDANQGDFKVILDSMLDQIPVAPGDSKAAYILAEIYGKGVQDLHYNSIRRYRIFDLYMGCPGQGRYLDYFEMRSLLRNFNVPMVPLLFAGEWLGSVQKHGLDGEDVDKASILDPETQREGVVVKPLYERKAAKVGRVVLKHVHADYLTRKHGTERN